MAAISFQSVSKTYPVARGSGTFQALDAVRFDIEEGEFVGALLVVARRNLHRVTRIAQLDEVDTLDDASAGNVKAGNDAFG